MRVILVLAALCASTYLAAAGDSQPAAKLTDVVPPDYMPPPWQDPGFLCRANHHGYSSGEFSSVCDPSGLLSAREMDQLNSMLEDFYNGISPYSLITCQERSPSAQAGFRVAVALVRRMTFDGNTLDKRAEDFAHTLFQRWNLNENCGAGVLLFLSLEDRRMYLQTGRLATKYLNEHQIDHVYKKMIPLLGKRKVADALFAGVRKIGSYLRKYQGKHGGARDTTPTPSGFSAPLFFKKGPSWWDLELSIVAAIFAIFVVIACCNGAGGMEATRLKKEKRDVLRKLNIVRAEYVAAMLPQYTPGTCPICHDDLTPTWVPTVPTLPENTTETPPAPTRPVRSLRCGHNFHEACFDEEHPTPSGSIPQCPICGDQAGGTSTPPTLSSTRGQDVSFRLKKLQDVYPNILTEDVIAKLNSEPPNMWPESMTEAYLRPERGGSRSILPSDREEDRHNGFWGGLGGLLAAGGIGALLASAFSGWGNRGSNGYYTDIPAAGAGGHVGQWVDNTTQDGGGHGASWGDTLGNAVSHISGGGLGTGWGGSSGNGGGDGGGHGSDW